MQSGAWVAEIFVESISPSTFCFRFFSECRSEVDLIESLTVAEDMYGEHIPVEELMQDVTPESARNFLQSDLVIAEIHGFIDFW